VDVGVGFADRATVVVAVGFSQDLWVLHISICITPETAYNRSSYKVSFILVRFDDTLIFPTVFRKILKYRITPTSGSSGSLVFPCGRIDRHDEGIEKYINSPE
jgi:hypothetical protein